VFIPSAGAANLQIAGIMAKQIAREEERERRVAEKKAREAAALEERLKKRKGV